MKPERCSNCNHKIHSYEIYGDFYHCINCDLELPYPPIKKEDMETIEDIQSSLAIPIQQAINKHGIELVKQALRWIYES